MPDTVEDNVAQQIARGGPDPRATKGDSSPGRPTVPPQNVVGTVGWTDTKGTGRRLVALHTFVDGFERGTVFSESKLRQGADANRLVAVGAVREATPEEAELDRVTNLDETAPNLSYESLLAEKDRQIEMLNAQKAELQTKIASRQAAQREAQSTEQGSAAAQLIEEKDRRIRELEGQLKVAEKAKGK